METTISGITLIYVVLTILFLVMYIVLCIDIHAIRKNQQVNNYSHSLFLFYVSVGETEKAKDVLFYMMSKEESFESAMTGLSYAQERLIEKYKDDLEKVKVEFSFDNLNE